MATLLLVALAVSAQDYARLVQVVRDSNIKLEH